VQPGGGLRVDTKERVMPFVESTAIERIDYNTEKRLLFVTFTSSRRYVYFDVPSSIYRRFLESESQGRFFNSHIRDHYDFRELA
jgi:lysyl-tRNA synthetase class 2